jgi:hypothetical protein
MSTARHVGGAAKHKWTPAEDHWLSTAVGRLGSDNWQRIAAVIPGRTGKQCRERWVGHVSPGIVREDWSPEEDLILVQKQAEFGNHWAKIKTFLPGRSVVAAKNRWNWLCRRNVPKHTGEFEAIAKMHTVAASERVRDAWLVPETGIWGDQAMGPLDFQPLW